MVELTDRAVSHLTHLRRERGFDDSAGVRLVRSDGRMGLRFERTRPAGDRIVERPELTLYLSPEVASSLDGSTIDAKTNDGRTWLVVRRRGRGARQTA